MDLAPISAPADVLSELLKPLRLTDIYSSKWLAGGTWGVVGEQDSHAVLHYMVRGSCFVTLDEAEPVSQARQTGQAERVGPGRLVRLEEGDLALFPHGTAHTFSSAPGRATAGLRTFLPDLPPGGSGVVTLGSAAPDTELLCASLHYDPGTEPGLYRALPRVLVLRAHLLRGETLLLRTLDSLSAEIGRTAPGARLVSLRAFEMVFVLSLRAAMERLTDTSPALRALRHAGVSKALTAIYSAFAQPWTVGTLAREAGMSRSVFSQVFRELVGEPPARHLLLRRLQEARLLLADGAVAQRDIPGRVGYESRVGFHLAFRREFGMTPGEYRALRCGGAASAPVESSPRDHVTM
ncbi:AraC family transcriptional regulator [Streptomyces sp. N2-109]|uniref:AraC family transcriptional regulator n=1 Tax=Streptomyces gossypii TaxID=2883101 RepID=A0ABT2JV37_9ACTN|nr:AraC family transcriptional regulator [Streptomyces gossypii]MCT2591762.1 AraC family transcriptional regulator [Streptomyces gossypii]